MGVGDFDKVIRAIYVDYSTRYGWIEYDYWGRV
jgi:hypothetical protein